MILQPYNQKGRLFHQDQIIWLKVKSNTVLSRFLKDFDVNINVRIIHALIFAFLKDYNSCSTSQCLFKN